MLLLPLSICIHVVKAEPSYPGDCIRFYAFTLYSPLNRTYNSQFLTLDLTFGAAMGIRYSLYYYLDGVYQEAIPYTIMNPSETHVVYQATASAKLPVLSLGSHSLTIFFICGGLLRPLPSNNETVYFNIDLNAPNNPPSPRTVDATPPIISDISLDNKTCASTDVPLNFTVSENASRIAYSLDGQQNVTIVGNATLNGLMVGAHNVTVYCWDEVGNVGASKTVSFYVADTASEAPEQPEFFLTALVVAASLAVAAVFAATVLVYWKKRKR
jgi:hypothetical protein